LLPPGGYLIRDRLGGIRHFPDHFFVFYDDETLSLIVTSIRAYVASSTAFSNIFSGTSCFFHCRTERLSD
jgi:hypothetical protein